MPSLSNSSINEKSLTGGTMTDVTVDEATMTVDEALQPVDVLGLPITKGSVNEKSLTNLSINE